MVKICYWYIKWFRFIVIGVVNQNINFIQFIDSKVCQCREFLFGSNIIMVGKCLIIQLLNFVYNMVSCVGVNIIDYYRCVSCCECNGDFFINICICICDDGVFFVEFQVVRIKYINFL